MSYQYYFFSLFVFLLTFDSAPVYSQNSQASQNQSIADFVRQLEAISNAASSTASNSASGQNPAHVQNDLNRLLQAILQGNQQNRNQNPGIMNRNQNNQNDLSVLAGVAIVAMGAIAISSIQNGGVGGVNRTLPDIPPNAEDRRQAEILTTEAINLLAMGKKEDGLIKLQEATIVDPTFTLAHYNLACLYAKENKTESAISSLSKAIELDKKYIEMARMDPDFDTIRNTNEFRELVK